MPKSDAIEQSARQLAHTLKRFDIDNSYCSVVIDAAHRWNKGGIFKVSVRLQVPGERLYLTNVVQESTSDEVLHSAVREAFGDIERQLKKHRSRRSYPRQVAALAL